MSAPMAASPSAIEATRSDSLTRSSAAPVIRLVPGSCDARTASTGSSSIISAAMPPLTDSERRDGAVPTSRSPTGSRPSDRAPLMSIASPHARRRSMTAVRVGLMPTLRIRARDPRTSPETTSQKAAPLRSPGIARSSGARRLADPISTRRPSTFTSAPIAASISSVWLRVPIGSSTAVRPSANRPARSTADFTWALGTLGRYSIPCNGTLPPTSSGGHEAFAPISRSGATTRSIGLVVSDSSPLSSEANPCAASNPASSLIVVPEFPQSSASADAWRPCMPTPRTTESSISTPSARMQPAVDLTSAPVDRPRTWLSPSAIEPRISARCEIDLSPGTVISPSRRRALLTVAITGNPLSSAHGPSALPRKARRGAGRRLRDGGASGRASG